MDYTGPGCGILSLVVTERCLWCLDFKGGLYCSALPDGALHWQRFEDNVQQVAVSPSGKRLLCVCWREFYSVCYLLLYMVHFVCWIASKLRE